MKTSVIFAVLCFAIAAAAPVRAAEPDRLHDPEVRRALVALEQEPTIQETQLAALKFFDIDPDTIGSLRWRAAFKSVLPSLGSSYRYGNSVVDLQKWDYMQYPDRVAGKDAVAYSVNEVEVSANWDLSRLMFNPEVLDVGSLVVLQEGVAKEVTQTYFTRRRLQIDLILNPPADPAVALAQDLRLQELTATLDAMTGNLFSKAKAKPAGDGSVEQNARQASR